MAKVSVKIAKVVTEEVIIPEQVAVFSDKRTNVKTVALPFQFPDGVNGIISVTRLSPLGWQPSNSIGKINIEFKPII